MKRTAWIFVLLTCMAGGLAFFVMKVYLPYRYVLEHRILKLEAGKELPFSFKLELENSEYSLVLNEDQTEEKEKHTHTNVRKYWTVTQNDQDLGILEFEGTYLRHTQDYYYFLKYRPKSTQTQPLIIQASIGSTTSQVQERHIVYPPVPQGAAQYSIGNSQLTELVKLGREGGLPLHSLFLDGEDFNFFVNMINVYEPMGNGVRKVNHELIDPMYYKTDSYGKHVEFAFPNMDQKEVEQWGIIGRKGMFAWAAQTQNELKLRGNFDYIRKWTQGGVQYIPDPSYVPFDPWAFWVVPAQHVGDKFLLYGKDRFADNMALLSLQESLKTQTSNGNWISTPKSSWLYQDYRIGAGFYDTRFNTDAALFLLEGYRKWGDSDYVEAAKRYGDFLIKYANTHHYETQQGGYLVQDYSQDGQMDNKTHVSLNHLLAEMNFLYELYLETSEQRYLTVAEKMRTAVKDTRDQWIKAENGDLWYAYLANGTFGKQDYMHLTLKDLRVSQDLIERVTKKLDPDFAFLIQTKESYLKKNGFPLYDWEDMLVRKGGENH